MNAINGVYFILPEACKPCLFLSSIQFAQLIVPYQAEVEQLVGEYVYFYNYERINLKDGLSPVEIRSKAA